MLVVSHATSVWGAERRILTLAPLLRERGIECTLACPSQGQLADAWAEAGLPLKPLATGRRLGLRLPDGSRPGPVSLAREAALALGAARRIAQLAGGADVLWSNSLNAHIEVALAGRLARRPTVLHLHDIVAPGTGRWALAAAVRLAGRAIALTDAVAACAGRFRGLVTVVHNGVDTTVFSPGDPDESVVAELGGGPGRRLVGVLGRVDPEKGIETAVDAVGSLPAELNVHLAVVGAPLTAGEGYFRSLRQRAEAVLGPRVRFLPPTDDVVPVLRALDVLVNASPAEPFGRTIIEAQACGLPVVAVRGGGVPEFVDDGRTGLLVPPRDPAAMATALQRVLTDHDLRVRLVASARARVVERLTVQQQAEATAAVIRAAVARHTPRDRSRASVRRRNR